jgi:hypothetical protein
MNFGSGGGDDGQARAAEARRENAIADSQGNIMNVFGANFTPDFYDKRRQAYLSYAKPQLNDQYADARKQLVYSLDRSGNLASTARTTQEAQLAKLYDQNNRTISDQALGYENDARNNVANAESGLLSGVAQTGNVGSSIAAANNQAAALSQPDVYQPMGQLFGGFTSALQTQAGLEQLAAAAGPNNPFKPAFNTGLFASANDVRNT